MRAVFHFLGSAVVATALACAGCNSSEAQQVQTALNNAQAQSNLVAADAANVTTAANAAGLNVPTASQALTVAGLATTNHLTAAQALQIQTILQQGTANDQKNGLTAAQQADNTRRRLLVLAVLFGGNPGVVPPQ